ncbi:MAG TPA: hypothetical protein VGT82_06085 [Ktedonobacteraceae bacterium]|nr:hypothetical protein [Ktedonobacteraceae bacterium]
MDQTQRSQNISTMNRQAANRSRAPFEEDELDDIYPTRMPSSTRRYRSDVNTETGRARADAHSVMLAKSDSHIPNRKNAIPPRRAATQTSLPVARPERRSTGSVETEEVSSRHSGNLPSSRRSGDLPHPRQTAYLPQGFTWSRLHWTVYVGTAMLIMLVGWLALSSLSSWWQVTSDDWRYGRPRTFQTDAVVGHNDASAIPSHFIALNLQRHVEVIEMPGGDASKAKIYTGPVLIGQGQDLAVVTLSFKDVNGDNKPDMIVNIQDSRFVFINDGGGFRPARPGENVNL